MNDPLIEITQEVRRHAQQLPLEADVLTLSVFMKLVVEYCDKVEQRLEDDNLLLKDEMSYGRNNS